MEISIINKCNNNNNNNKFMYINSVCEMRIK